ncbi:DNA-binding protein [Rhizobium puerariae]|uniref:DNA-binding protein n=1 Tax=Rhizobium puerariae TaxID=1585791 RepID=A0ABV6AMX4_9HYPH
MTPNEQVRLQFEAEGISMKEWAEARGYAPRLVYAVVQGKLACKRGVSHKIAVELGIKKAPETRLLSA